MKASRFIEQACLLGDDQKFITAIIVPNFEFLGEWVDEQGLMKVEEEELVVDNSKEVQGFIESIIIESQKDLSDFERAKAFVIAPDDWNEYNELLTPSLKMKRPNILNYYSKQIRDLYGEAWMD